MAPQIQILNPIRRSGKCDVPVIVCIVPHQNPIHSSVLLIDGKRVDTTSSGFSLGLKNKLDLGPIMSNTGDAMETAGVLVLEDSISAANFSDDDDFLDRSDTDVIHEDAVSCGIVTTVEGSEDISLPAVKFPCLL